MNGRVILRLDYWG